MLKINILCVGKLKEQYLKDAVNDYSKRLSKYCTLTITELPDESITNDDNKVKLLENQNIVNHIKEGSYVIALTPSAKQESSEEFSELIDKVQLTNSEITFVIGGSLGLNELVLERANQKISFSNMTFPHGLFRVILLEQIYRAFKISKGETYHK